MNNIHQGKSGFRPIALWAGALTLASTLFCAAPVMAAEDYSVSGELNTIFRMQPTVEKKHINQGYEYLRLNLTDNRSDGSGLSFFLGAWGRGDFAERTGANGTDGDLQYAYLTYRAPKNNGVVSVGRQFITEGVATERIDGLYLRSDFDYGFGAAAFFGNSVITEPDPQARYQGGGAVYGARISQANRKYYNVGLSILKSEREDKSRYREEEGFDLWLHPSRQIDLTGRSTYNSITEGWMEHSYSLAYMPQQTLRFGADFSRISFKDYLATVTTPALGLDRFHNPLWGDTSETQTVAGTSITYTGIKDLTASADFKFYSYHWSGDAPYFGCKANYSFPDGLIMGASFHRMEGDVDKLRYDELRGFISKKIGHADLTVDAINVYYDKEINGIRNSYSVTGAAGYELSRRFKLGADLEYSRNPDFNNEVRAIVKALYTFDSKFAAEGRTKSEK